MAGSPFFLKNFMHTLGHFDIYGCLFAIGLLLIPARSLAYVLLAALLSMILILIHHIHLLMYVPTIAAIVVLRHYLIQDVRRQSAFVGIASLAAVGALFRRRAILRDDGGAGSGVHRLSAKPDGRPLANQAAELWLYLVPAAVEGSCSIPGQRLPHNLLGIPVFALLIWLHTPIWRYFRNLIAALSIDVHRRIVIAAIVSRQPRLSRHVRDDVRLFEVDFELGGVPVLDPACGEDTAGFKGGVADIGE